MMFIIEMECPKHGLERFKVKVIRKYNVKSELILPKIRKKPKQSISGIIIGRNVTHSEVQNYLFNYFRETGLINNVLSIKFQK